MSAGGGLAAAVVLLSRDRQEPVICAQCLICPTLDDRFETVSSRQYVEESDFMTRLVVEEAWKSSRSKEVGPLAARIAAPGTVEDLSNLPTTFLDVGSAEVLRDETVAYASRLWAGGVQAELHVWPGGFHGFDIFLPDAAISRASREAKVLWAKRTFEI